MTFDKTLNIALTESTGHVNKFDIAWQIVRAKAKKIKDPIEKIDYVIQFLNVNPNVHNFGRIMNWLKMTKVAYKDSSIQSEFDEEVSWLESHKDQFSSTEDNEMKVEDLSNKDLLAVYKDLREYFTFEDTSKTLFQSLSSFDSNAAQVLVELENRRLKREKDANRQLGEIVDKDGGGLLDSLITNGMEAASEKASSLMQSLVDGRKKLVEDAAKFEKDQLKLITQQAKKEHEARQRLAENALNNAKKHFEEERQRQMKMNQEIQSMMSGAGAEMGSGAGVRFNAQQANKAIADSVSMPQPLPTDEQLVEEAKKQLTVLQESDKKYSAMVKTLSDILLEQKQNGFKRIR
jgi:hypothetical protein